MQRGVAIYTGKEWEGNSSIKATRHTFNNKVAVYSSKEVSRLSSNTAATLTQHQLGKAWLQVSIIATMSSHTGRVQQVGILVINYALSAHRAHQVATHYSNCALKTTDLQQQPAAIDRPKLLNESKSEHGLTAWQLRPVQLAGHTRLSSVISGTINSLQPCISGNFKYPNKTVRH